MGALSSFLLTLAILFASRFAGADVSTGDGRNCSCGFYDGLTEELFTDSIIVYFNESTGLPTDDFLTQDYANKYEKQWNTVYRQGAIPSNVQLSPLDSLELYVNASTGHHLVNGGGLQTIRRDIQHGSFRSLIKSPRANHDGSAMSMMWKYNETEVTELSVMNTDHEEDAWVGTFINNEFTTRDLGVNYSVLLNSTDANRNYTTLTNLLAGGSVDPWDYTEYRIDWTKEAISFYIGGNNTRTILHKHDKGIPSVPAPFFFKHWSSGNKYSMEGPPKHQSVANIGWIRMFFNSSLMDADQHVDFVSRCPLSDACSMDDITLRGATPYTEAATHKWKQHMPNQSARMPAVWISVVCATFTTALLLHTFLRRAPWKKQPKTSGHGQGSTNEKQAQDSTMPQSPVISTSENSLSKRDSPNNLGSTPGSQRPSSDYGPNRWQDDLVIEKADPSPATSVYSPTGESSQTPSVRWDSRATTPRATPYASAFNTTVEEFPFLKNAENRISEGHEKDFKRGMSSMSQMTLAANQEPVAEPKIQMEVVTESAMPAPRMRAQPPPPRQRIDYLAGLVAFCATVVTIMHFGLSYVPALVIPGAPVHYRSEYWAQKIIAPFILNQMWLGVFFTTSTRFLVAKYLKTGNLKDAAHAAVRRTPRLMIPIATIVLFEYFLIDCGATNYLQYTPSISWSTWPYVAKFPSFGHYISEVLELIYLIPNAVPQITFNYCTGVLWTIAVQLQGSWLVLLGAIIVREMKTPWKRFGYYTFCILNHWYAQSWGSYLWFGVLLTDLDITYKYRPWLYARPQAYYPLITFCWICVAAGFAANVAPNWSEFNFATLENNIHPDTSSGDPLLSTGNAGYPSYFVPRLNGLLFAVGMQAVVELSPAVQWILGTRVFLWVFPHIFTIYLLHGLVFWSWGSWLMVFLAERDFVYGVNVAIVGVTSYTILILALPIVTPILDALGKDITAMVWTTAIEKSPERRRTLFPFPDDLFDKTAAGGAADVERGASWTIGHSSAGSSSRNSMDKGFGRVREKEVEM